jgi:hypothetical protein
MASLLAIVLTAYWFHQGRLPLPEVNDQAPAAADPAAPAPGAATQPEPVAVAEPQDEPPSSAALTDVSLLGPKRPALTNEASYDARVSRVAAIAYDALVKSNLGAATTSSNEAGLPAAARARSGAAGLRGYVASESLRRSMSEVLREARRNAIAEANRPATNQTSH